MPPLTVPSWTNETVYLVQFARAKCCPSLSPFCLKVETWLRIADIKYENVVNNMGRSERGQKPYVELNGKQIADSTFIIEELAKHFNKHLEAHLTDVDAANAHAQYVMMEQSTLWLMHYMRTLNPDAAMFGKAAMGDTFRFPTNLFKPILKWSYCRKMNKKLLVQGYGLNTRPENVKLLLDNLRSFSGYLGTNKYTTGDTLTKLYFTPLQNEITKFLHEDRKHDNIKAYLLRVKAELYPDWDAVTVQLKANTDWKSYKKEHA